jgi:transcriptional regulator with XRE-family HTH domain
MDLKKMGAFLKDLRKDEGLTQEELAEKLYVSSRSISRWERGNNMPDVEILMSLADFYKVDLVEILNGERKDEIMDKKLEETTMKVSEYEKENNKIYIMSIRIFMIISLVGLVINHFLYKLAPTLTGTKLDVVEFTMGAFDGFTMGTLLIGILISFGVFRNQKVKKFLKMNEKAK